jgi:hypothetical protein
MATPPPPLSVMPQMRLRGFDPAVEVGASNLSFVLGETSGPPASLTLRQGVTQQASTAFLHVEQASTATMLCASDRQGTPEQAWDVPGMSFRTWVDSEEARIDGAGMHCRSLSADSFTNLVNDYSSANVTLPPSAAALNMAYITLSNMIVMATFSGAGAGTGAGVVLSGDYVTLLDSYTSSSVLQAPTANALRGAYYNLSNMFLLNAQRLAASVPALVRSATVGLMSNLTASNADVLSLLTAPQFALSNDLYLLSTPDGQPRVYYGADGATVSAAPGTGDATAFSWFASGASADVMRLTAGGDLWVRGGVAAGGALAVASLTADGPSASSFLSGVEVAGAAAFLSNVRVAGELTAEGDAVVAGAVRSATVEASASLSVGANVLTAAGSNVGLNLPPGTEPSATLHVNGTVFSTESMFALSDESVKDDIQPIPHAAAKVRRIRGCSYVRNDLGPDALARRQVGVIAQHVSRVLPEAVQVGEDGRMSVAYGNLVALALEAIREVSLLQQRHARRLVRVEAKCHARPRRVRLLPRAGRLAGSGHDDDDADGQSDVDEHG